MERGRECHWRDGLYVFPRNATDAFLGIPFGRQVKVHPLIIKEKTVSKGPFTCLLSQLLEKGLFDITQHIFVHI